MNFLQRALSPPSARAYKVGPATGNRYQGLNQTQMSEWDAEQAIRQAYLVNVTVYRCIQIKAETVSSLPFRAGLDPLQPKKYDTSAPLARLLGPPPGGPNPDMGPSALWANAVSQWDTAGRFAWELERQSNDTSPIVALWPLVAQHLRPIPAKNGEKAADGKPRYFKGFEYDADPTKEPQKLSTARCYYDWRPSLHDLHQPESPLQAARLDISVAVMQDIYDRAFLQNDARPAGLLVTQEFAERKDYDAFKDRLNATYGGPGNAGKTMVVEQDSADGNVTQSVNWISLGISQKDADFFQRYQQKVKNICSALGVPMSLLDSSDRTFSNADAEYRTFWINTILPLITRLSESINIRLAPQLGPEVGWFDISEVEVLQPPRRFVDVSPIEFFKAGLATMNEMREVTGLSATDAGDVFYEPVPAPDALPAVDPTQPEPPTELPVVEEPKALPAGKAVTKTLQLNQPASGSPSRTKDPEPVVPSVVDRAAVREKQWRSVDAQVSTLESTWERSMSALFRKQEKACIARLEGKRGKQALSRAASDPIAVPNAVFEREFWETETAEVAESLYETVVALANARIIGQLGPIPERAFSDFLHSFILSNAQRLARQITDTTYKLIKRQMIDGVKAGEDKDKLTKRIKAVFASAIKSRSKAIAVTEVFGGYNRSTDLIGEQYPLQSVAAREWISEHDERVRVEHKEVDGQVALRGEQFLVAGITMRCPHDPSAPPHLIINCRCTLLLLSATDLAERAQWPKQWRSVRDVNEELIRLAVEVAA